MITISGASGFIGRHLVQRLLEQQQPADLDCLVWANTNDDIDGRYERKGQEALRRLGVTPLPTDLVTGQGLDRLRPRPPVVFHLAGCTRSDFTIPDQRCNDVGTQNFLKALGPLDSGSHVLFTSSCLVMDDRSDFSKPLTEASPVGACSPYGVTKIQAENWLKEYARQQGFALTILRLPTVYGQGARPFSLFLELQKYIRHGSFLGRLNWPGQLSFIHVDDVVEALVRLSQKPPKPGESQLFVLGSESHTLAKASELLHRTLGVPYRPLNLPRAFWKMCSLIGRSKRFWKRLLPFRLYFPLWRGHLLVDNILWCETNQLTRILADKRPRLLEEAVPETLEESDEGRPSPPGSGTRS